MSNLKGEFNWCGVATALPAAPAVGLSAVRLVYIGDFGDTFQVLGAAVEPGVFILGAGVGGVSWRSRPVRLGG